MIARGIPSVWYAHALHMLLTCLFIALCCGLADGEQSYAVPKHDPCELCHRLPAESITPGIPFPPGVNPSSVCLDCHNYGENHHPVGFVPEGSEEDGRSYNGFPLFDGEMRCLTCHEPHAENSPTPAAKMLRGGPYKSRTDICFRCHDQDLSAKVDPHVMFGRDGRVRQVGGQPVCLMCHSIVPDQSRGRREVRFKADVAFLCWRCHPPMDGSFFSSHFLVKPSKTVRAQMRRTNREAAVSLPLLHRGRITCSTCHNPHQDGVILDGPAQAGADEHDRLRLPKDKICEGCHGVK